MNCLCVSSIGTWRSMRTNYTILFCQLVWHDSPVSSMATSQKWFTSLMMFSEVLKLPSSHCSPLSFSKLLGKPPQEALKVNLIAPMALMQARDILGIWSFGVIGGRAGRVFITARQSWATCSPSASFEIFEMVMARGEGERERERERDLYLYIYIHICMCIYIYMHIHIMRYIGQIWSYMVLYIYHHISTGDSCPIFGFVQLYRYDTSMCLRGCCLSYVVPAAVCCTWGPPWHIIRRKGRPRDTARRQWKLRTLEVELFIDLWSTIVNKWLITVHNVYWFIYWWIMVNNG